MPPGTRYTNTGSAWNTVEFEYKTLRFVACYYSFSSTLSSLHVAPRQHEYVALPASVRSRRLYSACTLHHTSTNTRLHLSCFDTQRLLALRSMGCGKSRVEMDYDYLVLETITPLDELFSILGIEQNEQRQLFRVFDKMDKDGGRKIDFEEFCAFFSIPTTNFARRCFLLMDAAGAGEMSFPQFCICAWNYCTYDAEGLATFAFNLYDNEGMGIISNEDMYALVEDNYDIRNLTKQGDWGADLVKNSPEYNMKLAKLKIAKAAGIDEQMDLKEWLKYTRTAPNLLKKAFVMQHVLQSDICGEKFWEKMTRRRRRKTKYKDEVIDWASIDEILANMERDPKIAKVLKVKSKGRPKKAKSQTSSNERSGSGRSLSSNRSQSQRKEKKRKSSASGSKYATKEQEETKTRTRSLKRVRSQEEEEFTRQLPNARNTGKVLKRKKSAENIQKMMRMNLAKKRVAKLRESKKRMKSKMKAVRSLGARSK